MIKIECHVSTDLPTVFLYRIEYYLENVRVFSVECDNIGVCLIEIEKKMKMDMGHLKGKVFTTQTGREL